MAEDQGGLPVLDEIRQRFGPRVAHIVESCTDSVTIPKPPWRERKELYLTHLAQASPEVLRVSAADKVHNARAIVSDLRQHGPSLWGRFTAGREGVLWYYRALAGIFVERRVGPLAAELARVVEEMERLA